MSRYRGRQSFAMEPDGHLPLDIEPGDEIRWGDWTRNNLPLEESQRFTLIPYSYGSDYSGTLVERSNYNYIVENYSDEVVLVEGGHGTFGVGFLGNVENLSDGLQDCIAGLMDYPLADESGWSELEWDTANSQWAEDGVKDFRREVAFYLKNFTGEDWDEILDEIDDTHFGYLQWEADSFHGGEWFLNEQGSDIWFNFKWLTRNDLDVWSYVAGWLNKHADCDYHIPTRNDVLADAIHDWFLPFHTPRCLLAA